MHKHLDMLDRGGLWKVTQTVIALLNIVETCSLTYVKRLAIWYHLHNFKNVKNTHGGVLLLVKLQTFSL